jgi:hypothetical protein
MSDEIAWDHFSTSARSAAVSIDALSSSARKRRRFTGSSTSIGRWISLARVSSVCTITAISAVMTAFTLNFTPSLSREDVPLEGSRARDQITSEVVLHT